MVERATGSPSPRDITQRWPRPAWPPSWADTRVHVPQALLGTRARP
jgi:hypothetical protein